MSNLSRYLKQVRQQKDRSRRWVERQSRNRYPRDKERHISHSYLRQIEEGLRDRPNPLKLQTLAEIYQVDYHELMAAAGYLKAEVQTSSAPGPGGEEKDLQQQLELVRKTMDWLERNDIRSEYFLRSLTGLSKESLALVNRLLTSLSIQEKQLKRGKTPAAETTGRDPLSSSER